jgi:hypothetical protein
MGLSKLFQQSLPGIGGHSGRTLHLHSALSTVAQARGWPSAPRTLRATGSALRSSPGRQQPWCSEGPATCTVLVQPSEGLAWSPVFSANYHVLSLMAVGTQT